MKSSRSGTESSEISMKVGETFRLVNGLEARILKRGSPGVRCHCLHQRGHRKNRTDAATELASFREGQ